MPTIRPSFYVLPKCLRLGVFRLTRIEIHVGLCSSHSLVHNSFEANHVCTERWHEVPRVSSDPTIFETGAKLLSILFLYVDREKFLAQNVSKELHLGATAL